MNLHDESDSTNETTQPLPHLGALAFQLFLAKHGLSILDVALVAQVRLVIVWKITRGQPISPTQAQQVRGALFQLTPAGYRGQIAVYREMPDKS
jgi:hypothetical protein